MEEFQAFSAGGSNGESLGCALCPLISHNSELFLRKLFNSHLTLKISFPFPLVAPVVGVVGLRGMS